ncbi:phage baseplate protein [Gordonibacter pamelaeae]|uniref:phage baseplate protein n=1 Tax=Gordonibacter pamelaeae TaxID=471189 RepID=UPI0012B1397A|nr:hypothetical protein [Gordonibacter pamelaeae]MSA60824.1 hypothetical protein [Gordonibacter pamelaeae]
MDAYDIALLMANQDPSRPLKMRYGTVADNTGSLLQVVPDGQTETTPVVKCCHPLKGDRVILLVNGTEWLAISVIGGESAPPRVGQPFITAASEDPHIVWPNTRWRKLEDRFILASGMHSRGTTGGEESHLLTEAEMPEHSHFFKQHNNDGSDTAWIGSVEKRLFRWSTENIMSAGSSQAHNNMPPYEVFDIWIRFE